MTAVNILKREPDKGHYTLENAAEFLRHRGWLAAFPPQLRDSLLARCKLLPPLARGQVLCRIGDKPDGIYALASGSLAVQMAPNEQGPETTHLFRPGAWFGEIAYILDVPRTMTMIATRPSRCLILPRADLEALTAVEPLLWRWLAVCVADNMRIALCALDDMTIRSPQRRLAAALLRMAGLRTDDAVQDDARPELDLTHGELARLANISRTAVGENLRHLEEQGFVERSYGRIALLKPADLRSWLRETA